MTEVSLVLLSCRTSDRTPGGVLGAQTLAPLIGKRLGIEPRTIGSAAGSVVTEIEQSGAVMTGTRPSASASSTCPPASSRQPRDSLRSCS